MRTELDRVVLVLPRGLLSEPDDVVLMVAADAFGLASEDDRIPVDPSETRWLFESTARRDMPSVRLFAAHANCKGLSLHRLGDADLVQAMSELIDGRELVGLRPIPGANGAASNRLTLCDLVRRIEGAVRGPMLLRGQQYKLVSNGEIQSWLERPDFRVLSRVSAESVLDELAVAPGTSKQLGELLAQARRGLAHDWRWPDRPDGLVMLQRKSAAKLAWKSSDGPTYTPSELKAWVDRKRPKLHSFEIIAYDSFGRTLPGVPISLHIDGADWVLKTDDHGRVRYEGASNQTATARVDDLARVRDLLAPRWAEPPEQSNTEAIRAAIPVNPCAPASPLHLVSEVPTRIVFRRRVVRVRLIGMYFDHAKCFLLPGALQKIRKVVDVYREHPQANLLIVGHTDTRHAQTADQEVAQHFNRRLSMERAKAIAAYLTDDVDGWFRWYKVEGERRWGTTEDLHMLARAGPDGTPYYREGADPKKAARHYQMDRDLPVTGTIGERTRRALIQDYMSDDGTTLPPGIKLTTHGCGPYFPDSPTGPNDDVPANRRVEIFVFHGPIVPPPSGDYSEPGSPEYPAWAAQVEETIDLWLDDESSAAMGHFRPRPGVFVDDSELPSDASDSDTDSVGHFQLDSGVLADDSDLPSEASDTDADSMGHFQLGPGALADDSELAPEASHIDADDAAPNAADIEFLTSPQQRAEST